LVRSYEHIEHVAVTFERAGNVNAERVACRDTIRTR
jgi:hypothetical protein